MDLTGKDGLELIIFQTKSVVIRFFRVYPCSILLRFVKLSSFCV
jgi:hypothetical protein